MARLQVVAAALTLTLPVGCAQPDPGAPAMAAMLPPLDSALARVCRRPVAIPAGTTAADVDRLWSTDRLALDDCADVHAALVARDAAIAKALAGLK